MPSRETLWFVPLLVVGAIVGMALTIFLSPAIGVPLLVVAALIGLFSRGRRQTDTGRMEEFREQAGAGADIQFSERDRATLTPSQGDQTGN